MSYGYRHFKKLRDRIYIIQGLMFQLIPKKKSKKVKNELFT
ncbi:hypothetical protein [Vagococcus xieshaowenii]